VALNGQELTFFGREGQNPNGTKLRESESKLSNIIEQNQNYPNLEGEPLHFSLYKILN
jgi:hypothetical protein